MTKLLGSVGVVAILLGASVIPSAANTLLTMGTGVITVPSSTAFGDGTNAVPLTGTFWDDWSFFLAAPSAITITSASYNHLNPAQVIFPFQIEMFHGPTVATGGTGSGTEVDPSHATLFDKLTSAPLGNGVTGLSFNGTLAAGFYYLEVMGTCGACSYAGTMVLDTPNGGTQGTPLPAALPLFVSGLGLLGFFGKRRKKQTEATAA